MKNTIRASVIALAAALPALPIDVLAQSAPATTHDPVIVTANRVARTADETLAPVTVITREDIERQQAQSVPDLLRGLPGVALGNNGGPGKVTSLFLRGTNSDQVLVLVDGFKLGSASSGTTALQDIPVDQIERIEIVRGPRASLYGSDAIGGVIQIFTRKGTRNTGASFTTGSRHTMETSVFGGVGSPDLWASAGARAFSTHGINTCQGNASAGCFTNEPDRDGYRSNAFNLHGGTRFGDKLDLELMALQADSRNAYDGSFQNESSGRQQLFGGTLRATPFEAWTSTLKLGQSLDETENYLNGKYVSLIATRRSLLTWQNDVQIAQGHQINAGFDSMRDKLITDTGYAVRSRTNHAFFTQYIADIGNFSAQASLRRDENEQFGGHNTGGVATGYRFSNALHLNASYATAFKAPTFNQLYYPFFGTPTLKPEKSRNKEIGIGGDAGSGKWQVNVFDNRISQLIVTDPSTFTAQNISAARIHGAEFSAAQKWAQTTLAASATFQNPKDHSGGASEGDVLQRRPRQTARVDLDHDLGDWSFGTTWLGVGKRYDNTSNSIQLGGYSTWDLRSEYRIDKEWRVQLRIENAFDKRYETAYLYNQPGFGAFLTLRYVMK